MQVQKNKCGSAERAFSIIELILVIIVVSILATIIVGRVGQFRSETAMSKNNYAIGCIINAMERARSSGVTLTNLMSPDDITIENLVAELRSKDLLVSARPITSNQVSLLVVSNELVFFPTDIP